MNRASRFEGYNLACLRRDLISGTVVGIIAIPLGMAFAIASGVSPQYGLYTSIVAGFLISLLGGSKYQIGGPTGAFIPVLLAIVLQYGYEDLLVAGMMGGVLIALMGILRLGAIVRYIPRPVIIGFTAGIAVIIFTGQIGNFLGLEGVRKHEYFLDNMNELLLRIDTINVYSIICALVCFAVMQLTHRYWRIVPPALTGLVVSTLVAVLLFDGKVPTIGSAYGAIPSALPALQFPELSLERVLHLIQPALVIALLGSVESLLSAVVADGMTGERHRSNRELIGQGVANIVTPLFGGIPATGAIARTAANIRNGAVSPVSGMVHSIFILLVVLTFAPLASAIPLASMAPILMNVAWNMSERRHFAHILRTKTSDSLILIVTFALTVLLDITIAVQAGLVLAVLVFVVRMARSMTIAKVLPDPARGNGKMAAHQVRKDRDCPQIHIYTVEGPLFFGTADALEGLYDELNRSNPRTVILRMAKVPFIDLTGESNLSAVVKAVQQYGGQVILTGIQPQPLGMLQKTGLAARIGPDLIFERTGPAVDEALRRLDVQRCLGCRHYAFRECVRLSESVSESACESAAASAVDLPKAAVPSS